MAKKKTQKKAYIPVSKKRLAEMSPENRKGIVDARKRLRKESDLNKEMTSRKRRAASQTSGTKIGRRMPRKGY